MLWKSRDWAYIKLDSRLAEIERYGRLRDLSKLEVFSLDDMQHPLAGYYADGVWSRSMKDKGQVKVLTTGGIIVDYTRKSEEQHPV